MKYGKVTLTKKSVYIRVILQRTRRLPSRYAVGVYERYKLPNWIWGTASAVNAVCKTYNLIFKKLNAFLKFNM